MINKKKSIVVYGAPGCGSNYIARDLGERTGMPVISVQRLARLGKADELRKAINSVNISLDNLEAELEGYKSRIKNDNGLMSGFTRIGLNKKIADIEKRISWYETVLPSLQRDQQLRLQYPSLPNIYDLGYDRSIATAIREKHGDNNETAFYEKQFIVDFAQELYKNVDGACILDFGPYAPVTLVDRIDEMTDRMDHDHLVAWSFRDGFRTENLSPEKTAEMFEGFGTVANLQLPADYKFTRYNAYINPLTKELISQGDYQKYATISIDTTGLFEDNVTAIVNSDAKREVTYNQAKSNIICSKILVQTHVQDGGQGQQ